MEYAAALALFYTIPQTAWAKLAVHYPFLRPFSPLKHPPTQRLTNQKPDSDPSRSEVGPSLLYEKTTRAEEVDTCRFFFFLFYRIIKMTLDGNVFFFIGIKKINNFPSIPWYPTISEPWCKQERSQCLSTDQVDLLPGHSFSFIFLSFFVRYKHRLQNQPPFYCSSPRTSSVILHLRINGGLEQNLTLRKWSSRGVIT